MSAGSVSSTKCTSDSIGAGTRTSWVTIVSPYGPRGARATQAAPRPREHRYQYTRHTTGRFAQHGRGHGDVPRRCGGQAAAGPGAGTTSAPPWRRCPQARWPEAEPMAGGEGHESDTSQETAPPRRGGEGEHDGNAADPLPLARAPTAE